MLSKQRPYELRTEMVGWNSKVYHSNYDDFWVSVSRSACSIKMASLFPILSRDGIEEFRKDGGRGRGVDRACLAVVSPIYIFEHYFVALGHLY